MSPKKITDADKLEIVTLYRQTRDTTTSLANRYGVSTSTIGRILKNSIPEAEYDILIHQKRGAKVESEADGTLDNHALIARVAAAATEVVDEMSARDVAPTSEPQVDIIGTDSDILTSAIAIDRELAADTSIPRTTTTLPLRDNIVTQPPTASMTEDLSTNKRLVRRRSSARFDDAVPVVLNAESTIPADMDSSMRLAPTKQLPTSETATDTIQSGSPALETARARGPQVPVLRKDLAEAVNFSDSNEIEGKLLEDEADEDTEDVTALAAMFGEEIAEGDEDDEDDEDWDDEAATLDRSGERDLLLTGDRTQLQVTPLSQATLPRTCYIVIDKFAELIVRPLKDFAELGQIPGEEIQQRTLPIFDNHRVAKRFSNQRTQRVIKVPDSKIFQKTIDRLRAKGITRLLVDGNIYSLN